LKDAGCSSNAARQPVIRRQRSGRQARVVGTRLAPMAGEARVRARIHGTGRIATAASSPFRDARGCRYSENSHTTPAAITSGSTAAGITVECRVKGCRKPRGSWPPRMCSTRCRLRGRIATRCRSIACSRSSTRIEARTCAL
jgi:hypothetical protein